MKFFSVHTANQFQINAIYPNPFNPSTTISWEQQGMETFNVSIFNIRGELTNEYSLINGQPGYNTFNWHPKNLSAGVYLVRLTGETFSSTQKAIYLK